MRDKRFDSRPSGKSTLVRSHTRRTSGGSVTVVQYMRRHLKGWKVTKFWEDLNGDADFMDEIIIAPEGRAGVQIWMRDTPTHIQVHSVENLQLWKEEDYKSQGEGSQVILSLKEAADELGKGLVLTDVKNTKFVDRFDWLTRVDAPTHGQDPIYTYNIDVRPLPINPREFGAITEVEVLE